MNTLNYVRKATKTNHGVKGLVYRHRWETGAQDLVFKTEIAAIAFAASVNAQVTHKRGGK